jgi:predicted  nucleic acid-binding Zn-ribbon protein
LHVLLLQERAAARESELQDEMKAVQRAKSSEKQNVASQLQKMQEELTEAKREAEIIRQEKEDFKEQMDRYEQIKVDDRIFFGHCSLFFYSMHTVASTEFEP